MKGIGVRISPRLNRVMKRQGRVMGDRYHAHILRTPAEVKRARTYLLDDAREHYGYAARGSGFVGACGRGAADVVAVAVLGGLAGGQGAAEVGEGGAFAADEEGGAQLVEAPRLRVA